MAAVPPGGPAPGPAGPAPAPAAPAAPAVDALTLGSADLRFLLQRQGIDDDHLRKLFSAGVDSMDKFSAFASGQEDLFPDPRADPKSRSAVCVSEVEPLHQKWIRDQFLVKQRNLQLEQKNTKVRKCNPQMYQTAHSSAL